MCRLNDDDRRAVDILLDSPKATGTGNPSAGRPTPLAQPDRFNQRLLHVEQLLGLLHQLPATEPPKSLVHRTLQAIAARPASPLVDSASQPASSPDLRPPL